MSLGVVKVGYKKDIGKVGAHLKYIGFRSRDQQGEERGFFDADRDRGADYQQFLDRVEHDKALQHSLTPKVHTMILSMREDDYKNLVEGGKTYKDMARELLKELEARKGIKFDWIAAQHDKAGHPHVHVVIKSVGPDRQGNNRRLRLDKEDVEWLRQRMNEYIKTHSRVPEYERERNSKNPSQSQERSRLGRRHRAAGHSKHNDESRRQEQPHKERRNKRRRRKQQSREQQAKMQNQSMPGQER